MTQVNKDRDVTWSTKFPPRKIDGIEFKKGHSGMFPSEIGADNSVKMWKERGYYTRKELVFLHEGKDKPYNHPRYGKQWTTPGKAMWIVWRSVKKIPGRR